MHKTGKYLFIINPKAGKGKAASVIVYIQNYLSKIETNYKIILTEYRRHATEITKNLSSEYNNIIAVGGDGTLNEVVNGLNLNSEIILGLLPIGSGNDFSLSLKQPKKLDVNLDRIFSSDPNSYEKLRIGSVKFREQGSSEYKTHRFANAMGLGFDALVAHYNEQNKTLSGILSYIVAIFKAVKHYYPLESETVLGDNLILGNKLLFSVAKGKTSGGGFYLTPTAELFDDDFGICVIDFVKKIKLLRSLPLAIINKLDTLKEALLTKNDKIEISLKNPAYIHTDGEVISRKATNIEVELLKSNINVITKKEEK